MVKESQLSEYNLWHRGLTDDERAQWNQFVTGLEPGNDLVRQIDEFRFAGEPPPQNAGEGEANDLAAPVRQMIKSALE